MSNGSPVGMFNMKKPLGVRVLEYLPIPAILLLMGYYALSVDRYPSQIGVTHRSCSDPANSGRLTFRQVTYCVTPAEQQSWDKKWRNIVVLIATFLVCAAVSSYAHRRYRPST